MSENLDSVIVNGITITKNDAARFAPILLTHAQEHFKPCSIDYLLSDSQWMQVPLVDGQPDWPAEGVRLDVDPTPDNLGSLPDHGRCVKVQVASQRFQGQGWDVAPMYVSPQVPPHKEYVELTYVFLYAFNGPQSACLSLPLDTVDCIVSDFAKHQGDIESITVRVDPTLTRLQLVRFEAHGSSTWYAPDAVALDATGCRPFVGCALNSHASYNVAGRSGPFTVVLDDFTVASVGFQIVDFVQMDGPQWNITNPARFVFVGKEDGQACFGQRWANFAGRLGAVGTNSYTGATGVGAPLSAADAIAVASIAEAAQTAKLLPAEATESHGPLGLYDRAFLDIGRPVGGTPGAPVAVRCSQRPYLALSVDPRNPTGHVIVAVFEQTQQQSWIKVPVGDDKYFLVNQAEQLYLSAPMSRGAVTLKPRPDTSTIWNSAGDATALAIRSARDTDLNLDVESNNDVPEPGAGVCVWNWGGGKPNETWTIDVVSAITWPLSIEHAYVKTSQRPLYLTAQTDGTVRVAVLDRTKRGADTAPQLWLVDNFGCGLGFVNSVTDTMMCGAQDRGPVTLVSPSEQSESSIWSLADVALRPLRDTSMNLDVEAGDDVPRGGARVCIWNWGGGKPNECWTIGDWTSLPAAKRVRISCANRTLALQPRRGQDRCEVQNWNDGDPNQVWLQADMENGYFTIIHEASGLYLWGPSSRGAVKLANGAGFDDAYLWRRAGEAIQVSSNTDLNLDVESNDDQPRAGAGVCVWDWGGGQSNETWAITEV